MRDSDKCVGASDLMEFVVNKCWFCRKICKIKRIIEPINRIVFARSNVNIRGGCDSFESEEWREMEKSSGEKKDRTTSNVTRRTIFFSTTTTVMLVTTNKDTITLTENTNNFSIFHFSIFVVVCSFTCSIARSLVSIHPASHFSIYFVRFIATSIL